MLGVEVDGVERAAVLVGDAAIGVIVIRLHAGGVIAVAYASSAPAGCRPTMLASAPLEQPGGAGVDVALQRTADDRPRLIGFDPEARLAEVEIIVRVGAAQQLMRVLEAHFGVRAIRRRQLPRRPPWRTAYGPEHAGPGRRR